MNSERCVIEWACASVFYQTFFIEHRLRCVIFEILIANELNKSIKRHNIWLLIIRWLDRKFCYLFYQVKNEFIIACCAD